MHVIAFYDQLRRKQLCSTSTSSGSERLPPSAHRQPPPHCHIPPHCHSTILRPTFRANNNVYPLLVKNLRTTFTFNGVITPRHPMIHQQPLHDFSTNHSPGLASGHPSGRTIAFDQMRFPRAIHSDRSPLGEQRIRDCLQSNQSIIPQSGPHMNSSHRRSPTLRSPLRQEMPLQFSSHDPTYIEPRHAFSHTPRNTASDQTLLHYCPSINSPSAEVNPTQNDGLPANLIQDKTETPSNFRRAPFITTRGHSSLKHCVRKKDCSTSSSDGYTSIFIEKRIQRLFRRRCKKRKISNLRTNETCKQPKVTMCEDFLFLLAWLISQSVLMDLLSILLLFDNFYINNMLRNLIIN